MSVPDCVSLGVGGSGKMRHQERGSSQRREGGREKGKREGERAEGERGGSRRLGLRLDYLLALRPKLMSIRGTRK